MRLNRLFLGLAAIALLFIVGLLVVNAVDYLRYRRAVVRLKALTPAELRSIGDLCLDVKESRRYSRAEVPAALSKLSPRSFEVYPKLGVIVFDQLLVLVTQSSTNQQIVYKRLGGGLHKATLFGGAIQRRRKNFTRPIES